MNTKESPLLQAVRESQESLAALLSDHASTLSQLAPMTVALAVNRLDRVEQCVRSMEVKLLDMQAAVARAEQRAKDAEARQNRRCDVIEASRDGVTEEIRRAFAGLVARVKELEAKGDET